MDGQTDRRTDRQKDGRTDGQTVDSQRPACEACVVIDGDLVASEVGAVVDVRVIEVGAADQCAEERVRVGRGQVEETPATGRGRLVGKWVQSMAKPLRMAVQRLWTDEWVDR
jgi:hypothetical protein